ncbi:MAG: NAD-dependent epimerase/dehydratase family protein, partial [Myxococcales bacterium]|nr:NAD-dependent epimerase/dehydratase family protein [Myxococcales bacterium]
GGAGFIGSHLVDHLLAEGHHVTVVDDLRTGSRDNVRPHAGNPAFTFIEADVVQPLGALLADAVRAHGPVARVAHLAAQISVPRSLDDPLEDLRLNVGATLEVLRFAKATGVEQVVFSSSAAVYGDDVTQPVGEGATLAPISPYGVHKLASEQHVRNHARAGLGGTSLRFFNVYGPRQDPKSPYAGVIGLFLDRALRGEPLTIFGDGQQTRDFVYVADVVRAIAAALGRPGRGESVNVGTGSRITVRELADGVLAATGSASAIAFGPAREGEIVDSCADIGRARAVLSFEPRTEVAAGLALTASWLRARLAGDR